MYKRDRHTGNHIIKPTCVVDYCKNMGGVGVADQMLQYYEALRRTVKWWKKLFFHFLNLMVLNSYKLYLKYGNRPSKRSHQKFRSALVSSLVKSAVNAPRPQGSRGRKPEPLDRLQGSHFPVYIPAKQGAKRKHPQRYCVACNMSSKNRVGHKRSQSIYMCNKCEKPLCIPDCFRIYHTHKHFKRHLQGWSNSDDSSSDEN